VLGNRRANGEEGAGSGQGNGVADTGPKKVELRERWVSLRCPQIQGPTGGLAIIVFGKRGRRDEGRSREHKTRSLACSSSYTVGKSVPGGTLKSNVQWIFS
jgi:hypothetical protein